MKKIVGIFLMSVIMIFNTCAYAAADTTDAQQTEKVLISVKSKVAVLDELDKFRTSKRTYDGKTVYSFDWYNDKDNRSLTVDSDSDGRIMSYNYYSDDMYSNTDIKKIPQYSNDDVRKYADEFLKKLVPEVFSDETDVIKSDGEMYAYLDDNGANYNINYSRYKNGNAVYGDHISLEAYAKGDKLFVTNVDVSYSYDAKFEEQTDEKDNISEIYKEKFPVEQVYKKDYSYAPYKSTIDKKEDRVYLVYRMKDYNAGYISAQTGEIIKPDERESSIMFRESAKSTADNAGGMGDGGLTPQEITELDNMSNLISADSAKNKLVSLKQLKISNDISIQNSRVYKTDDGYYLNIYLEKTGDKDRRYVYARFDAETGKLLSVSNSGEYSNKELTENQKKTAENLIGEFVKSVASNELSECVEQDTEYYGNSANKSYIRVVNGIKYPENAISVTYSGNGDFVSSYYMDFDKDVSGFKSPDGAIDAEKAYNKMLEYAPLVKQYIPSGGTYKLAYTMDGMYEIDAFTGEKAEYYSYSEPKNDIDYTDIDGHWCENAVRTLAQYGIALDGNEFKPDENITQIDLFKLFGKVFDSYGYYAYDDADNMYRSLIEYGILSENERADSSPVKREDAFMYMVRMNGFERIASLSDIFKVNFADADTVTHSKTGYAAILSGMGVISGDGGYVRGNDNITRAEAVSLVYNWLTDVGTKNSNYVYPLDGNSTSVIGGADGPTSIYVK